MKENKGKKKNQKFAPQYSTQRYLWMGGILGLYFGWFFRPQRDPSIALAIALSILISLAILLLPSLRNFLALAYPMLKKETAPFMVRLKQFPLNLLQYFLIFLVFEGRHLAYDWGGRGASTLVTGLAGCIFGYWFMIRQQRLGL